MVRVETRVRAREFSGFKPPLREFKTRIDIFNSWVEHLRRAGEAGENPEQLMRDVITHAPVGMFLVRKSDGKNVGKVVAAFPHSVLTFLGVPLGKDPRELQRRVAGVKFSPNRRRARKEQRSKPPFEAYAELRMPGSDFDFDEFLEKHEKVPPGSRVPADINYLLGIHKYGLDLPPDLFPMGEGDKPDYYRAMAGRPIYDSEGHHTHSLFFTIDLPPEKIGEARRDAGGMKRSFTEILVRSHIRSLENKDPRTADHSLFVKSLGMGLASTFLDSGLNARFSEKNRLTRRHLAELASALWLHDVGKIAIPDSILLKPGSLTDEEKAVVQKHVSYGLELASRFLPLETNAIDAVGQHHEDFDGKGYPRRLKGRHISLPGRLASIADVLQSLTEARYYKAGWSIEQALGYLVEKSGTRFDPALVRFLVENFEKVNNESLNDLKMEHGYLQEDLRRCEEDLNGLGISSSRLKAYAVANVPVETVKHELARFGILPDHVERLIKTKKLKPETRFKGIVLRKLSAFDVWEINSLLRKFVEEQNRLQAIPVSYKKPVDDYQQHLLNYYVALTRESEMLPREFRVREGWNAKVNAWRAQVYPQLLRELKQARAKQ
ncbi:MAG: HD domain-containing phosphohydrolase [Candidatus Micrarchaeota archaeon]